VSRLLEELLSELWISVACGRGLRKCYQVASNQCGDAEKTCGSAVVARGVETEKRERERRENVKEKEEEEETEGIRDQ